MKKIRVYTYFLVFLLGITILAGARLSVKAEDKFSGFDSYTTRSFKDLYDANILSADDDSAINFTSRDDGIMITGNTSKLNDLTFTINKKFDFDGNRPGRLALNALAGKGQKLKLALYLDQTSESFAEISILNQTSPSNWDRSITLNTDILEKNITGEHTISFKIISEESGPAAVLLRSIEFVESDLPTIYLNLNESLGYVADMNISSDHSAECYGDMSLQIPKGYTYEYGAQKGSKEEADKTITYNLSFLRGRGNSTWEMDKKPYRIKLEKKADILGMGKEKNWALVANRLDNTNMRNKLTYWLGEELNVPFTPSSVPVDVIVNGIYYGSYYISETIRLGENRVNIDDLEQDETTMASEDPELITGGYLLSYDSWGTDGNELRFETERGFKLAIQSPSFEGYTNDVQFNYIKDYVQKTEDALFGTNFKDEDGKSWTDYMDLDSAVDYYLFEEFTMNDDGYRSGSNYLYKVRNGKLYWGPLWDFDFAYNNDKRFSDFTHMIHNHDKNWVYQMLSDPVFNQRLAERWKEFRIKLEEASKDGGIVDQYYSKLLISERYDMERWGFIAPSQQFYNKIPFTTFDRGMANYEKAKETLKTFIRTRMEYFDANLQEVSKCQLTLMVGDQVYDTRDCYCNYALDTIPDGPEKDGYYFAGWAICDENGKETSEYIYTGSVLENDTTAKAVYVEAGNKTAPTGVYLSTTEMNINSSSEDEVHAKLYVSVFPENAYGKIYYSSSNTRIVKVDQKGNVTIPADVIGEAEITVTCGGKSATCKVRILNDLSSQTTFEGCEVDIDQTELKLKKGNVQRLNLVYSEENCVYKSFQWISLDETIATVDQCGFVKGLKAGTTSIYLVDTRDDTVKECKITVTDPSAQPVITQKTQTITVKTKTKTLRYVKLKKKALSFKIAASAKTGLIYQKVKGNNKIKITKDGKVKVAKKLGRKTYYVKVKITAKASATYKAASKTVTIKIKVK